MGFRRRKAIRTGGTLAVGISHHEVILGMPLTFLGLAAGGGCGVGVGFGWGFGAAFGSKYRSSRIIFQGVEFDSKEKGNSKEFSKPSPEK